MIHRKTMLFAGLAVFVLTVAGCSLPMSKSTPPDLVFPTPNLTMTALFKPPVVIPPTVTPTSSTEQNPTQIASAPAGVVTSTALVTQAPVATAKPAATNTPAFTHGGPTSQAAFLSTVPSMDGNWSDWKTTQYPIKNVVFKPKNWAGSDDLEGAYRIGWDNQNLYLAVKVTDDSYVQNSTGHDLYLGDSIELLLDTNLNGDLTSNGLSDDDYQVGISAGSPSVGENPEAYLWYPSGKAAKLTQVKIGAVSGNGVYRVEASIPWSVFGVTPASGQQFGFAVSVTDNDNPKENIQKTMISSAPNRNLIDPTSWGIVTLNK